MLRQILLLPLTVGAALALFTHTTLAQTWQTVDDFQYVAGQSAVNFGLTVAPSGILFASGYGFDASGVSHGLVMASADAGNTWSAPLDDFVYPDSTTRYDGGMVSDSAGNLYVAGRYYFSSGPFHRFVRRSTDGGATGSTAGNQVAVAFATDSNGNLYVAGWASTTPSGGTYYWIVRKNPGGTSAWTTVDDFTYGSSAEAHAIVADGLGNLFVGGQGSPASGGVHWLVRKN